MDENNDHIVSLQESRHKYGADTYDEKSPEDLLEEMLSAIRAGEIKPDSVVIAYRDEESMEFGYYTTPPLFETTIATLECVQTQIKMGMLFGGD